MAKCLRLIPLVAACVFGLIATQARAGLVVDGGFENATLAPSWTASSAGITTNLSNVHTGTQAAFLQGGSASLTQSISGLTSGTSYQVEFWLRNSNTSTSSTFTVKLGSTTVASLTNATTSGVYTKYDYLVTATGPIENLQFGASTSGTYYVIDDVSMVVHSPEPSTIASAGVAVLFCLARAWRQGRRPATN